MQQTGMHWPTAALSCSSMLQTGMHRPTAELSCSSMQQTGMHWPTAALSCSSMQQTGYALAGNCIIMQQQAANRLCIGRQLCHHAAACSKQAMHWPTDASSCSRMQQTGYALAGGYIIMKRTGYSLAVSSIIMQQHAANRLCIGRQLCHHAAACRKQDMHWPAAVSSCISLQQTCYMHWQAAISSCSIMRHTSSTVSDSCIIMQEI